MNINAIDLNLLKVFVALHDTGKQILAAEQVGLSQPALSHALKRLRDTFRDELFQRRGGQYVPTPKSVELYRSIKEAMQSLEDTLVSLDQFDPATAQGKLSLAVSDFSSSTILSSICAEIERRAPGLQLVVSQLSYTNFESALQSGETDVAITSQIAEQSFVQSDRILSEEAVYIARNDHPDFHTLSEFETFLKSDDLIVNLYGRPYSWIDEWLAEQGKKRRVKMVVPYFSAVPDIVARTNLLGGLPKRLAEEAANAYPVTMFPMPFDFRPVDFFACWHTRRRLDPKLRWFRGIISDVFFCGCRP